MTSRRRILLAAPSCDGTDVGEAWVAHQWASLLGERHDVTLLTSTKHGRPAADSQLPGVHVVAWDEPRVPQAAERFNSMLKPAYPLFHRRARRWIAQARARGEAFDIGFQPTPVAARYPSPLAGSGLPFIVGPVGGGLVSPPGFSATDTDPWFVRLRGMDRFRRRFDPILRHTYHQAEAVLGIAPYVADVLGDLDVRRFAIMSETALAHLPPEPPDRMERRGPVRALFVGRLVRAKGARDAIAAMGRLRDLDVVLDVVGDGFDRAACERLVRDLDLNDRVLFHGHVHKEAAATYYADADIFLYPSFREPGGNVALEAMGAGLPLVVADRGGPASAVSDQCAFRVRAVDPETFAAALAESVRTLVEDPTLRHAMGRAAREHVARTGLWSARVAQWEQLAEEVLSSQDTGK